MLLRGLTARENLAFLAAFRGLVASDVAVALRKWGLGDDMDRPIERLSAGQRRRASLARIETEQVPLVLLDEPFADLDSDAIVRLRAALNSALVRGQAVLIATHLHHELDQDATRRYLLDDGALREI
jgi:heme exporter protein A